MSSQEKLSLGERLGMIGIIVFTLFKVAFTVLRHLIFPPEDSPGPARAAYGLLIRSGCLLSPKQESNSNPTNWSCSSCALYEVPANLGAVIFPIKCAMSQLASLVLLEYTLAPEAHYPTQSHQGIEALRRLLTTIPASRITIAGDSAGAHLALSILSHINHPLPEVEPIVLTEKLGGICIICPFLSFNMEKESYTYNGNRDILTRKAVENFNSNFRPPGLTNADASLNPRLSPLDSPVGWFKGSPVKRILLTMGEREVMFDDIVAFDKKLQAEVAAETTYEFLVGKNEMHSAPLIDSSFGLSDGQSAKEILLWMSEGAVHLSK